MKCAALLLVAVILLTLGLSDAEAKTTKFQESLRCQPTSDCSSTFTIQKGAKATLTISVATSDNIRFKMENPNGDNVRLSTSAFPDMSGLTQVFTRVMTADVAGDYTFYFLKPIPQNFEATISVVIEDTETVEIRDIPSATPNFEGGCLIATATYGSELAPQVQMLREIRDNSLLETNSGKNFMNSFNEFYYSFSPYIADYVRENPIFREAVKVAITPMISSLSILNYVEMDSEESVLVYGISLILLNVGMYFGVPAIVVIGIRKKFKFNPSLNYFLGRLKI
jgi:hypothetical protein